MLAFCCCSFGISLALICWFSLRKPCDSGGLSLSEDVLPITLCPPDWVLRLVEFGTGPIDLLLLHQKVNLLLNPLQVLVELRLDLDHGLCLGLITFWSLSHIRHRNSSLVALCTLAPLYSHLPSRITSSICALLLAHLILNNISQLFINIEPIDKLISRRLLIGRVPSAFGYLLLPIWVLLPRRTRSSQFHNIILVYSLCFIHFRNLLLIKVSE